MSFPDSEMYKEFFNSLSSIKSGEIADFQKIDIVPTKYLQDNTDIIESAPIQLFYQETSIKLSNIITIILEEVDAKNHVAIPDIAKLILAIYSLSPHNTSNTIERMNFILESIEPIDSTQYLISPFPPHADVSNFNLERFTIGRLDRDRLLYWCNKVNCDYFQRNPNSFINRFSIYGSPCEVNVINWPKVLQKLDINKNKVVDMIIDHYFDLMSYHLQSQFKHEFHEAQLVFVAEGAPLIDLDNPRTWMGGTFICVFYKRGNNSWGYFCPQSLNLEIDYAQVDQRIPKTMKKLENEFSFTRLTECEIHKSIATFCRFVLKAKNYRSDNRRDESFLHYIIALDLLFGEKYSSTRKISKRTSLVIHKELALSFDECVDKIKKLYDKRSKYVHKGIGVTENDLLAIEPIIMVVFHCLMRLQSRTENVENGFIEKWQKKLDSLIAEIEAGEPPHIDDYHKAGINTQYHQQ